MTPTTGLKLAPNSVCKDYSHTGLKLGPYAKRAYRGPVPPDPPGERERPTHDIGKITAHRKTAARSPGSKRGKK